MAADWGRLQTLGRQALRDGVAPGSPEAERLVAELFDDGRAARPATVSLERPFLARVWPAQGHRSPGGRFVEVAVPRPPG